MVPPEVIDEILNRVSLVDVISRSVEVKKTGRNYKALCPFHNERTPSFVINEDKGFYHCFGCGASGNAYKFLMEYNKLTFRESLEEVAKMAGIDLSKYETNDGKDNSEYEKLYDINKAAMLFFHNKLMKDNEGEEARRYFKLRRISPETVKKFRLGFGGTEWKGLLEFMKQNGFKEELMLKASLISQGERGNTYDRFKDRVLFPIFDRKDRIVGFGGRILDDNSGIAKYLNTSENDIFHKGNLLYGLNFAVDDITKKRVALLVEGYMDVIALAQNSIHNSIAPLGTGLTDVQLRLVKRYADELVFVFDGDDAGLKAASRAIDVAAKTELKQYVVILPDKKDPYDIVMKDGAEHFLNYIENEKKTPLDFKLWYADKTIDDKVEYITFLFEYVKQVKHLVVQEEYLKTISNHSNIDISAIRGEYHNYLKSNKTSGRFEKQEPKANKPIGSIELHFIAALCAEPERINEFRDIVLPTMIKNKEVQKIFEFVLQHSDKSSREILDFTNNEDILKTTSLFIVKPELNPGIVVAYKLKSSYLKQIINENKVFLKGASREERTRILQEQQVLIKERDKIDTFIKRHDSWND